MQTALTSTGTCFTIGANDITLDCSSYGIMGDTTGSGVYNNGYTGVTVKNCNITRFNNGTYFSLGAHNGRLINNNFSSDNVGVNIEYSNNVQVWDTSTTLITKKGIFLNESNSTAIINATVSNMVTGNQQGIYLYR